MNGDAAHGDAAHGDVPTRRAHEAYNTSKKGMRLTACFERVSLVGARAEGHENLKRVTDDEEPVKSLRWEPVTGSQWLESLRPRG